MKSNDVHDIVVKTKDEIEPTSYSDALSMLVHGRKTEKVLPQDCNAIEGTEDRNRLSKDRWLSSKSTLYKSARPETDENGDVDYRSAGDEIDKVDERVELTISFRELWNNYS